MKKLTRRIIKYSICFIAGFVLSFVLRVALLHKVDIYGALGVALGMTIAIAICDLILNSKKNKKSE